MSLLMDALRKAEADKKQASAAASGSESEQPGAADFEVAANAATREFRHPTSSNASEIASPELPTTPAPDSLGPDPGNQALALEPLEVDQQLTANDAAAQTRAPDDTLIGEDSAIPSMSTTGDVESQIKDPLEGLQSIPDLDPAAVVAEQEASPWGSGSGIPETVAAANTVFDAGKSGPPRRAMVWGALITVVIACGLASAGFFYFGQPPTVYQIPSPSVALNVEKSPPAELPPTVAEPPSAVEFSVESVVVATADDAVARKGEIGLPPADDAGPVPEPLTAIESRPQRQDTAPVADQVGGRLPAAHGGAAVTVPAAPQVGVRPGEVRIARSDGAGDVSATMTQAYAAYVAGNFTRAGELYRHVLSQRPQQRDALLGVAALKLRAGEVASAHQIYRQVLKRHPDNPTASAALFSIEGGSGDQVTEARLKMLLDQGVDVGYIYFSLGNLYARSKRWADAQQAYFEALRNNPANPDYNYNLAVALDRIGQHAAAVKYYAAALNSTDAAQAGFDTASALARIDAINSGPSR